MDSSKPREEGVAFQLIREMRLGCLPLPTGCASSALPAKSSHSDLLQPKAICQLPRSSYNAAQGNKSEKKQSLENSPPNRTTFTFSTVQGQ